MMQISPFVFSHLPEIHFGPKKFQILPTLIFKYAKNNILVITGKASFIHSPQATFLWNTLKSSIAYATATVQGEPSPDLVDNLVKEHRHNNIEAVIAIGGGSVIDTGKAVSAMLYEGGSCVDYLEGVGKREHTGKKLSFIAVPTTAGTGSELTKNAVLSRPGANGFKASMRHDNFIPDSLIVDPELMLSCPQEITASCGMDALTQLLEPLVSTKANPITDALALSGIQHIADSLQACYDNGQDIHARTKMAYSAMLSGITLANAGLGLVHGFAAVMGGLYNIPHGVICGTLLATVTEFNIKALQKKQDQQTLAKYAQAGACLAGKYFDGNITYFLDLLIQKLVHFTNYFQLAKFSKYHVQHSDCDKIVQMTSNKNNPVALDKKEMAEILARRI